ncbi:MAG: undecaprenyldiphospho-muramoylpentapeptide beta-N-acetylglucosaminyltransferase [bacterium]
MRILLTGGGTCGHITPSIAVAKKIKSTTKEKVDFLFVGSIDKNAQVLLESENIKVKNVACGKFRRYFSLRNFTDIFKLAFGMIQAMWIVYWFMPDVVFSKGGFASFPGSFAAWFFRCPIIVHESDSVPGLANLVIGKMAKIVIVAFEKAGKYFKKEKVILIGNPIREELLNGSAEECKKKFELQKDKPLVFVTGGSLGASFINEAVLRILVELTKSANVIHQCGNKTVKGHKNIEEIKKTASEILGNDYEKVGYHPVEFIGEEMKDVLACADLIITRGGANALAETTAIGKPSIIIPIYNSPGNHQRENAFTLKDAGAGIVIEQPNLTPNLFLMEIRKILENPELAKSMGENAKKLANPEAAQRIAEVVLKIGKK